VGEKKGECYTIDFRSVGESVETPQGEGSSDPFAPASREMDNKGVLQRLERQFESVQKEIDEMKKMMMQRLPPAPVAAGGKKASKMSQLMKRAEQASSSTPPKNPLTSPRVALRRTATSTLFSAHLLYTQRERSSHGEVGVNLASSHSPSGFETGMATTLKR